MHHGAGNTPTYPVIRSSDAYSPTSLYIMTGSCADDCLAVKLQTGDRKGNYFELDLPLSGTIKTYIAGGRTKEEVEKTKADKIILWMADIYGPHFINNCLFMDWLADQGERVARLAVRTPYLSNPCDAGYLVISPDYFHGEQVAELNKTPGFTLKEFIPKFLAEVDDGQGNKVGRTTLLLREWMPIVKKMFGKPESKYGIVGFCFGAPPTIQYCTSNPGGYGNAS